MCTFINVVIEKGFKLFDYSPVGGKGAARERREKSSCRISSKREWKKISDRQKRLQPEMHVTIPSSSHSGKENYTEISVHSKRTHRWQLLSDQESTATMPAQRMHPPEGAGSAVTCFGNKIWGQDSLSALLTPSVHLHRVSYARTAQRGKRRTEFTSKRSPQQ